MLSIPTFAKLHPLGFVKEIVIRGMDPSMLAAGQLQQECIGMLTL